MKKSSTRVQRNNFWACKRSWRCLEDVLKTFCKEVLKTPWKIKNCYAEDIFKTSLKHIFKTSSRRLGDKKWRYLYLTNLNQHVSNKSIFCQSIFDKSKANPKSLIRTQWSQYLPYLEIQAAFLFWELKSMMTVWCCEISWI